MLFEPLTIAKVLIDGPSDLIFDYRIDQFSKASAGCRVKVPMRNKSATGTILSIETLDEEPHYPIKPIQALIDEIPLITPIMLKMANWMKGYYGASMEQVIRALLPESVRKEDQEVKMEKIILLGKVTPSEEEIEKLSRKAPKQAACFRLLTLTLEKKKLPSVSQKVLGGGEVTAQLKALAKKDWVVITEKESYRDPDAGVEFTPTEPRTLNPAQQKAYDRLVEILKKPTEAKPVLLQGVTGSGKTEVYLQLAQKVLEEGKAILVVLPEISLTPQTVQSFKARFHQLADQVAVLHSHLSQGERFDAWRKITQGERKIIIGARSAIFAPVKDLGLIIVDEEHDTAFKQDSAPRYHGRDVAVLRAFFEKCPIVLGTATPSLETQANVEAGKYEVIRMDQRADGQSMPLIRVVDMKLEAKKQKVSTDIAVLSEPLRQALQKRLDEGEQTILFLNRRGFARSINCDVCGLIVECSHCSLAMTYHRTDERLICHICGHQALVPKVCPDCKDPGIRLAGYGTQKVGEILQKVFPQIKLSRLDADTSRRKNAVRQILSDFRSKKTNVLLGTQMIAKGLDFPNVTLVGVLNADLGLHAPDFRAGERTFQLLTQVAGRAGRGDLEGEVIIQTFTPHSPSIQFARHHDFDGFAEQELEIRRMFQYPPYAHIGIIHIRSTHEQKAELTAQNIFQRLEKKIEEKNLSKKILINEPLPSPLVRAHDLFRFQLLLRSTNPRLLSQLAQEIIESMGKPQDVVIVFDMDALSLG